MPCRIVTTHIMTAHRQLSEASSRSAFPHGIQVLYKCTKRLEILYTQKVKLQGCALLREGLKIVIAACLLNNITSPPDCVEGATEEIEKISSCLLCETVWL